MIYVYQNRTVLVFVSFILVSKEKLVIRMCNIYTFKCISINEYTNFYKNYLYSPSTAKKTSNMLVRNKCVFILKTCGCAKVKNLV